MEVVVAVLLSLLPHVHDDANEEEVRLPPFSFVQQNIIGQTWNLDDDGNGGFSSCY